MWDFAWVLGSGFAVPPAILNASWGEHEEERRLSLQQDAEADLHG